MQLLGLWLAALLALLALLQGTHGLVIVNPDRTCRCPRRDIREIDTQPSLRPQRDLLLLALTELQTRSTNDFTSYFQMARIHGSPAAPYDGVGRGFGSYPCASGCSGTASGRGDGFCWHGSATFVTWHRPYLILFEQELVKTAKRLAATYPTNTRATYVAAANQLRLPFWAWEDPITSTQGPPAILVDQTRPVLRPTGATATIANPFYRYRYQLAAGRKAAGSYTARDPNWVSRVRNAAAGWRQQVAAAFATQDFNRFASQTGSSTSIESPHGSVHVTVGGSGDMSVVPQSAFDPIFWLHHCNVDKLIAQWQTRWPNSWVGTTTESFSNYGIATASGARYRVSGSSPLWPFRWDASNDVTNGFWWGDDARDITSLGYTAPGVGSPAGCCAAGAGARIAGDQEPIAFKDPNAGTYRTILSFEGVDASQFGNQSFTIYVYLEDKKSKGARKNLPTTSGVKATDDPFYAGSLDIFTSGAAKLYAGTVDVTESLLKQGIVKEADNKRKPPADLVKRYVRIIAIGSATKAAKRTVKIAKVTAQWGRYEDGVFVQEGSPKEPLIKNTGGSSSNARVAAPKAGRQQKQT